MPVPPKCTMRRFLSLLVVLVFAASAQASANVGVQYEAYDWYDRGEPDSTCLNEDDRFHVFAAGSLVLNETFAWIPSAESCAARATYGYLDYPARKGSGLGITVSARMSLRTGEPPPSASFFSDGVVDHCGDWNRCYRIPFCLKYMAFWERPYNQVDYLVQNLGSRTDAQLHIWNMTEGSWYPPEWQGTCPGQS